MNIPTKLLDLAAFAGKIFPKEEVKMHEILGNVYRAYHTHPNKRKEYYRILKKTVEQYIELRCQTVVIEALDTMLDSFLEDEEATTRWIMETMSANALCTLIRNKYEPACLLSDQELLTLARPATIELLTKKMEKRLSNQQPS